MELLHCSLAAIRTSMASLLGEPLSPSQMAAAAAEAAELAQEAYVKATPEAWDLAERLLYEIHSTSAFSAPIQALPVVVWGALIRAKLASAIAQVEPCPPVKEDEMMRRLASSVEELGAWRHSLLEQVTARDNTHGLLVYTKNWVGSTFGFTHQLTSLSQRCTGEAKKLVLKNLADEFEGTSHDELRARFFEHVGFFFKPAEALDDPERTTESFALLNYRTAITLVTDPLRALGGFYSIEANFPRECMQLLKGLRAIGIGEEKLEIFTLHAEVDVDHSAEWLEILGHIRLRPEERATVVDGAVAQLKARQAMFDSMAAYLAAHP